MGNSVNPMSDSTINVLFYIEPRVDAAAVYLRQWWFEHFARDLMAALQRSSGGERFRFCLGVSEAIYDKFGPTAGAETAVITHRDLYPPGAGDAVELAIAWYRENPSPAMRDHYIALAMEKFGDFAPDIIVTFLPAPYLSWAFPQALIVHHEGGFMTRPPYPMTWYLDPFGMYYAKHAATNRFGERIKATALTSGQRASVRTFCDKVVAVHRNNSPFRQTIAAARQRFDHLALVPMLGQRHFGFDAINRYGFTTEYQYLVHLLEQIPQNIGVLVTWPPTEFDRPFAAEGTIEWLQKRYPHFVFAPEFAKFNFAGQYLLADVDAVVALTTGLCFQSMLFSARLIDLGECTAIADGTDPAQLPEILAAPPADKDALIYWLLTRYMITEHYLYQPQWIADRLTHWLAKHRADDLGFDDFAPFGDDAEVFSILEQGIGHGVPIRRRQQASADLAELFDAHLSAATRLAASDVVDATAVHGQLFNLTNLMRGVLLSNLAVLAERAGDAKKAELFAKILRREGYLPGDAPLPQGLIEGLPRADR